MGLKLIFCSVLTLGFNSFSFLKCISSFQYIDSDSKKSKSTRN